MLLKQHGRRPRLGSWFQFGDPRRFEWNPRRLAIESLPPALEGLRILHVTDLHLRSRWQSGYDRLIECVAEKRPDLILVTGDLVEDKRDHRGAVPHVRRLLDALSSRLGTFVILGNHDGDLLAPRLAGCRVTILNGHRVCLKSDGAGIELLGLVGPHREDLHDEFLRWVPPREPGTVRIVLSHYPDHFPRVRPLRPDLYLTGHTHGGQICLPGGFHVMSHDSLPRQYCKGIHRVEGTWLVVNRGLGFSGALPVRVFCPSEVIELELTGAEEKSE